MTVCKYLDLSTAHITGPDRGALNAEDCHLKTVSHDYGWWVWVPTDDTEDSDADLDDNLPIFHD